METRKFSWDRTAFDIFTRDGMMNMRLKAWLDRHHIDADIVVARYGLFIERNQSVERFLNHSAKMGMQYLCMIDADMSPRKEAEGILTIPGDLVYCGYTKANGRCPAHYGSGDLGGGCMRMSAKLLRAIEPPWFGFETNAKGTAMTMCECQYFLRKAKAAKFESKMVGVIGHLCLMEAKPDSDDPRKTVVMLPGR